MEKPLTVYLRYLSQGYVHKKDGGNIMFNISNIVTYDNLNPIEKIEAIYEDNTFKYTYKLEFNNQQEELDLREVILLSLYSIDTMLKNEGGAQYNYYIKDDNSIKYLIENAFNIVIDKTLFLQSLFVLDEAKLIYRFTCAKKFQENNLTLKQLRINSWGNEYIKVHDLIGKRRSIIANLCLTAKRHYNEKEMLYDRLMQLLLSDINEHVSKEIRNINENLNIKLLS